MSYRILERSAAWWRTLGGRLGMRRTESASERRSGVDVRERARGMLEGLLWAQVKAERAIDHDFDLEDLLWELEAGVRSQQRFVQRLDEVE